MPQALCPNKDTADVPLTLDQFRVKGDPFYCEVYNAKLTPFGCAANLALALRGWTAIVDQVPIGIIEDADLDRLMGCGPCPMSGLDDVDMSIVYDVIRDNVSGMMAKIENMNWNRGDGEAQSKAKKARLEKYRQEEKGNRSAYMKIWRYKHGGYLPTNVEEILAKDE